MKSSSQWLTVFPLAMLFLIILCDFVIAKDYSIPISKNNNVTSPLTIANSPLSSTSFRYYSDCGSIVYFSRTIGINSLSNLSCFSDGTIVFNRIQSTGASESTYALIDLGDTFSFENNTGAVKVSYNDTGYKPTIFFVTENYELAYALYYYQPTGFFNATKIHTYASSTYISNARLNFLNMTPEEVLKMKSIRYIGFGIHDATTSTKNVKVGNITIYNATFEENEFPVMTIENLKPYYCYNTSYSSYVFDLNATDKEGNYIRYFSYWNDEFSDVKVIDSFSNPSYKMLTNGWDFNTTGCNYSTSEGYLELFDECNNIQMVKWLDTSMLGNRIKIDFDAYVFRNTSNEYCILNWQNQRVVCIKLDGEYDQIYNDRYTNFSYWNGAKYVYFDSSYYNGIQGVTFTLNDTHAKVCIDGLDEPSYYGCNYGIDIPLNLAINNTPAKFWMLPTYNFIWESYENSFVLLDNLRYEIINAIDWIDYTSSSHIDYIFTKDTTEELNILVTDNSNYPDFTKYSFQINSIGICTDTTKFNDTNENPDVITDGTKGFVKAIPNGPTLFNNAFWIILFLIFVFFAINTGEISFAMILTGFIGLFASWLLTGDIIQMISSASLIGLGVTLLVTKIF